MHTSVRDLQAPASSLVCESILSVQTGGGVDGARSLETSVGQERRPGIERRAKQPTIFTITRKRQPSTKNSPYPAGGEEGQWGPAVDASTFKQWADELYPQSGAATDSYIRTPQPQFLKNWTPSSYNRPHTIGPITPHSGTRATPARQASPRYTRRELSVITTSTLRNTYSRPFYEEPRSRSSSSRVAGRGSSTRAAVSRGFSPSNTPHVKRSPPPKYDSLVPRFDDEYCMPPSWVSGSGQTPGRRSASCEQKSSFLVSNMSNVRSFITRAQSSRRYATPMSEVKTKGSSLSIRGSGDGSSAIRTLDRGTGSLITEVLSRRDSIPKSMGYPLGMEVSPTRRPEGEPSSSQNLRSPSGELLDDNVLMTSKPQPVSASKRQRSSTSTSYHPQVTRKAPSVREGGLRRSGSAHVIPERPIPQSQQTVSGTRQTSQRSQSADSITQRGTSRFERLYNQSRTMEAVSRTPTLTVNRRGQLVRPIQRRFRCLPAEEDENKTGSLLLSVTGSNSLLNQPSVLTTSTTYRKQYQAAMAIINNTVTPWMPQSRSYVSAVAPRPSRSLIESIGVQNTGNVAATQTPRTLKRRRPSSVECATHITEEVMPHLRQSGTATTQTESFIEPITVADIAVGDDPREASQSADNPVQVLHDLRESLKAVPPVEQRGRSRSALQARPKSATVPRERLSMIDSADILAIRQLARLADKNNPLHKTAGLTNPHILDLMNRCTEASVKVGGKRPRSAPILKIVMYNNSNLEVTRPMSAPAPSLVPPVEISSLESSTPEVVVPQAGSSFHRQLFGETFDIMIKGSEQLSPGRAAVQYCYGGNEYEPVRYQHLIGQIVHTPSKEKPRRTASLSASQVPRASRAPQIVGRIIKTAATHVERRAVSTGKVSKPRSVKPASPKIGISAVRKPSVPAKVRGPPKSAEARPKRPVIKAKVPASASPAVTPKERPLQSRRPSIDVSALPSEEHESDKELEVVYLDRELPIDDDDVIVPVEESTDGNYHENVILKHYEEALAKTIRLLAEQQQAVTDTPGPPPPLRMSSSTQPRVRYASITGDFPLQLEDRGPRKSLSERVVGLHGRTPTISVNENDEESAVKPNTCLTKMLNPDDRTRTRSAISQRDAPRRTFTLQMPKVSIGSHAAGRAISAAPTTTRGAPESPLSTLRASDLTLSSLDNNVQPQVQGQSQMQTSRTQLGKPVAVSRDLSACAQSEMNMESFNLTLTPPEEEQMSPIIDPMSVSAQQLCHRFLTRLEEETRRQAARAGSVLSSAGQRPSTSTRASSAGTPCSYRRSALRASSSGTLSHRKFDVLRTTTQLDPNGQAMLSCLKKLTPHSVNADAFRVCLERIPPQKCVLLLAHLQMLTRLVTQN
ncbi:hypothetical protein GMRT_14042 [Giardia muris]|uniref:Uncharacterized protein n=1 Tax=Giardia muris TaxID=5742 RepID=A0A4Z1T3T3_GIAMU|nr:hypothetical protein GMRT_14042 [Giardia muris]|eukprot:TNJ27199.1 hypothetical protein GMRT_14042 [Giardia muris]